MAAALYGIVCVTTVASIVLWSQKSRLERESTQKNTAFLQERAAKEARDIALNRYEQMSDVALLDDLVEREDRLWPCAPEQVTPMAEWLAQSSELLRRRAEHEGLDE